MTADALSRDVQTGQFLTRTEVALLKDRPELGWVVNGGPARPPTGEELARYEGQRHSASYADLMAITARAEAGECEPLLPVAETPALVPLPDPDPDVIEGEIVPDEAAAAEAQQRADDALARWGGKPAELHAVPPLEDTIAGQTAILPEVTG